jgi:hypothetical protein
MSFPTMRTIALFFALTVVGCGSSDPCAGDPGLCHDAGHDADPGTCTGQCVNVPPSWSPGILLWLGPEGSTPPACPAMAQSSLPGYADAPPTTVECPPCGCAPTHAFCLLSSTMEANKAACPGGAGQGVPFNAPDTWDGKCTAMDPIPSASSLEAPPPTLSISNGCGVSKDPPVKLAGGATRTLMCFDNFGIEPGACADPQEICTVAKVDGFALCLAQDGDLACPDGWPNKHLTFPDYYECVCSCGPPTGESCSSTLSVYADSSCSQPIGSAVVSSDKPPVCIDTAPGSPFGSKSATPPLYQSGTCTPTLYKSLPETLCCLP